MIVQRWNDGPAFRARAEPLLLAREAEHNLLLGLSQDLIGGSARYPDPPYLATVEQGGRVLAAALRTPPHNLIVSHTDEPTALTALAEQVAGETRDLPGVVASTPLARAFAEQWTRLTGRQYHLLRAMRIYQLTRVSPPAGVRGELRQATSVERELLIDWFDRFDREAMGETNPTGGAPRVDEFLAFRNRDMYLWHDGEFVTMTGYSGPTPNGIRIVAVYTPPELRRRGYASACVAAVSQLLLDQGRRFCFLYTDLNNSTANHIYQSIGYAPVCDVEEYRFGAGEGGGTMNDER